MHMVTLVVFFCFLASDRLLAICFVSSWFLGFCVFHYDVSLIKQRTRTGPTDHYFQTFQKCFQTNIILTSRMTQINLKKCFMKFMITVPPL